MRDLIPLFVLKFFKKFQKSIDILPIRVYNTIENKIIKEC